MKMQITGTDGDGDEVTATLEVSLDGDHAVNLSLELPEYENTDPTYPVTFDIDDVREGLALVERQGAEL